ncbi:MAG TPA: hypothetical protein VFJ04_08335 [Rhodanobacteraceae bacterium]|jgi:hypothetical protein|nr:hypothetical protein [Rhodanobacteraceae bacterium]
MRPIYASPRPENIDRVIALFAEHGIAATVSNRAVWKRPSYDRFSYSARGDRSSWPCVEVTHSNDLTRARALLREAGIEPLVRHADVLASSRDPVPGTRRRAIVTRVRLVLFVAIAAVLVLLVLKIA